MTQPIDKTADAAVAALLAVIEAAHDDPETRRACLRLAIEKAPALLLWRIDAQDHASRPDW